MALTAKPIEFTPTARLQLQTVIEFVIKEFDNKSAEKLILKIERQLQYIAEGRLVNRYFYKTKQIRYFIANRKNYILYQELKKSIRVVGIYSVYQDTNLIKRKIRNKK